jgi:hypothetical protein
MKTFQEFILEARLIENDQQEYAKIRAKIKMLQSRGRPGDAAEAQRLSIQAQELVSDIDKSAKFGAERKPKQKSRENTWVSGKPSKGRDTRGKGGSLSNIPSSDGEGEGSIVSGKQGDTRTGRPGGVRGTLINRGTARTGGTLGVRGRS